MKWKDKYPTHLVVNTLFSVILLSLYLTKVEFADGEEHRCSVRMLLEKERDEGRCLLSRMVGFSLALDSIIFFSI